MLEFVNLYHVLVVRLLYYLHNNSHLHGIAVWSAFKPSSPFLRARYGVPPLALKTHPRR